jgi:hypothetical protein
VLLTIYHKRILKSIIYNAVGDGDNVCPFIKRNEKYNYDCSKLDQWQIVFDHTQVKGLCLHLKPRKLKILIVI